MEKPNSRNKTKITVKKSIKKKLSGEGTKSNGSKKSCSSSKNEGTEFSDPDSLIFLGDTKERTKLKGVDDRIKSLKSELLTLMGKTDENLQNFIKKNDLVHNLSPPVDEKNPKDYKTAPQLTGNSEDYQTKETKHFKTNFNSTSSKTSELLVNDPKEIEPESQKEKPSVSKSPNLITTYPKTSSTDFFSDQEVVQLLYKSFLMQISDHNASSSEVICLDQDTPTSKKKPIRRNSKEITSKGKQELKKFSQKRKKRRTNYKSNIVSDVEVIDLDNSTCNNTTQRSNMIWTDLDVSDYNWNEPFEIQDNTQFQSDVQIIENNVKENSSKNLQSNSPEQVEQNKSVSLDDSVLPKKVWECPVCFERSKGQEIVATQCGHVFCKKCLEGHIRKVNRNCPTCRCDIKNKPFITLFNL